MANSLDQNGKTFLNQSEIDTPFFELIQQQLNLYTSSFSSIPGFPPFQGGMVGYLGYDAGHLLEDLPRPDTDEFNMPDAWMGFYASGILFDHQLKQSWIFSTGLPELEEEARKQQAIDQHNWIASQLLQDIPNSAPILRTEPIQSDINLQTF